MSQASGYGEVFKQSVVTKLIFQSLKNYDERSR